MSLLLYFLKIWFEFRNRLIEIAKGHPIDIAMIQNFRIIKRLQNFFWIFFWIMFAKQTLNKSRLLIQDFDFKTQFTVKYCADVCSESSQYSMDMLLRFLEFNAFFAQNFTLIFCKPFVRSSHIEVWMHSNCYSTSIEWTDIQNGINYLWNTFFVGQQKVL